MNRAREASKEIRSLEDLGKLDSPVHFLSPLSKLALTLVYVFTVASFERYNITGLFPMILIPLIGYALSTIPVTLCFRKLKVVLPVVLLVGIADPILDRRLLMVIGSVHISYGMVSMLCLILKGIFCILASFLLISTTPIDELCKSLRKIHMPKILVSLFLLTYRYVGVLLDEVAVMNESYSLRAPGQKGIAISSWGSFLGQLIVRSSKKAERNYDSMALRGFKGEFYYCDRKFSKLSWVWVLLLIGVIVTLRLFNISTLVGSIFVR